MELFVLSAIAGVVGANAGAVVLKDLNLGLFCNSIAGVAAGCILVLGAPWIGLDLETMGLLRKVALSGSSGVIAMAIAGLVYNWLA